MAKRTRRVASRQSRKYARRHRRSMMGISIVILLLTLVVSINCVSLQAKNTNYKAQETEITNQLEEEKQRTKDIEEYKEYVKTDEYTREIARERLGLADPNEVVFKSAK